ncbi:MAG: prenyltransferase, partial [Clostridiales Family XIII bacterium]|nr:prenyltransferase [Clostridiales Family XIII bacterium]
MRKTSGNISNMNALLLVPSELAGCIRRKGWQRLTPRAVLELAAPHTWGASVMPVILASAFAISMDGAFSFPLFFSLIATSVCLQCAVNTLNDYSDFISGADRFENCHDPTDASLVYHDYEPVLAFVIGVAFIGAGLLCGLYAIFTVGPELLIFGAVGAAVVFLYSYGILPLSYTPVGEFLSGVVMGGIIPVACFYAFTRQLSVWVLVYSIPVIVTIALIMMTNNGSDIEKDIESARHTLPTRIGRARTKKLHAVFFTAAMAAAAAVAAFRFPQGVWLLPLLCAWLIPNEYKLQNAGLTPENRVISMALSTGANIKLNAVYAAMILLPKISFTQTPISGFFA